MEEGFVVAVVAVIVREERDGPRVLAMRRAQAKDASPGIWETCSGRVHEDEQPRDAVLREVREETGLEVEVDDRPCDAYAMRRLDRRMIVIVYRAVTRGSSEVHRSDEHDAHAWWTRDEVERGPMPPRLIEAVLRALDG